MIKVLSVMRRVFIVSVPLNVALDNCKVDIPNVNIEDGLEVCVALIVDELIPIACDLVCVRGHHVTYSVITPSTVLVAVET